MQPYLVIESKQAPSQVFLPPPLVDFAMHSHPLPPARHQRLLESKPHQLSTGYSSQSKDFIRRLKREFNQESLSSQRLKELKLKMLQHQQQSDYLTS